jgi:hypothetical protein
VLEVAGARVEFGERWLDAVKPTLLRSEPLAAAISYYKNHRDALFRFVDDPSLAWSCYY